MRFRPIAAFKNPSSRPRVIVWLTVLTMGFVVFWAAGIVGTSFEWFCTDPCHIVHADNTLAYNASTHTNVSCIACHEPVNADPVTMTLMKIKVLPDLPATIFGTYEVPVNPASHVAMETPDEQCTQCHNLATRQPTPSDGIIINHDKHTENEVTCATCHNRVAHPEENIELVLGEYKHDNWMTMDACFRCHSLESDPRAPGTCESCHPKGFQLVPASHRLKGWYTPYGTSKLHAEGAKEESESVNVASERNSEHEPMDPAHAEGPVLTPSSEVNTCFTCHKTSFCGDCHQLPMPHPEEFKEKHGREGVKNSKACGTCHARNAAEAAGTNFCNACHHPSSKPGTPWLKNHRETVIAEGANPCFECHQAEYCELCHVRGPAAAERFLEEQYAE